MDGGGRLRAPCSSHDLGSSFGLDGDGVDVGARGVVDVLDGDVREAILGPRGELGIVHLPVSVLVELLPDAARLVLREAGS